MEKYKLIMILMFLIAFMSVSYWATNGFNTRPFKVIDPSDARFDAQEFRFEDYGRGERAENVINELFPPGTDKSEIDDFLINTLHFLESSAWHQDETGKFIKKPAHNFYKKFYSKKKDNQKLEYLVIKYTLNEKTEGSINYGVTSEKDGLKVLIGILTEGEDNE